MNAPGEIVNGVGRGAKAAVGHMPFRGHRTVAEVWEQEERTTRLAWCPAEHRDLFRILRRKTNSSAIARRLIEDLIEKERTP